jgi:hypothetical protein
VTRGARSPQSSIFAYGGTPYTYTQLAMASGKMKATQQFFYPHGTQLLLDPMLVSTVPTAPIPTLRRSKTRPYHYYINARGTLADTILPDASQRGTLRIYDMIHSFYNMTAAPSGLFDFRYYFSQVCPVMGIEQKKKTKKTHTLTGTKNVLLWVDTLSLIFGDVAINAQGQPTSVPANPLN